MNTLDDLFSTEQSSYGNYLHEHGKEYFWRSYHFPDERRLTFILEDDGKIADIWHQEFAGSGRAQNQMPKPIGLAEALRLSNDRYCLVRIGI